jgi:hypothetical protein
VVAVGALVGFVGCTIPPNVTPVPRDVLPVDVVVVPNENPGFAAVALSWVPNVNPGFAPRVAVLEPKLGAAVVPACVGVPKLMPPGLVLCAAPPKLSD